MTDADKLPWSKIRRKQLKGLQFYRQKIIGNYITDFYCSKSKLVIKVDGGQHYSAEGQETPLFQRGGVKIEELFQRGRQKVLTLLREDPENIDSIHYVGYYSYIYPHNWEVII